MLELITLLISLYADTQVNLDTQVMVVSALERQLEPGWYQDDWQMHVYDLHSTVGVFSV